MCKSKLTPKQKLSIRTDHDAELGLPVLSRKHQIMKLIIAFQVTIFSFLQLASQNMNQGEYVIASIEIQSSCTIHPIKTDFWLATPPKREGSNLEFGKDITVNKNDTHYLSIDVCNALLGLS